MQTLDPSIILEVPMRVDSIEEIRCQISNASPMAEFVAQILTGTTPDIGDEYVAMELGSCAGFIDGLATAHHLSVQLMLDFAAEVDGPMPAQGVDFSLRVISGGAAESDG